MSTEKKPDVLADLAAKVAKEKAESVKEYSLVDAVQLFDRIVLDAMVTRDPARKAIAEGDYTSTKTRQRVGMAIQRLGINPEALQAALCKADETRHRG